MANPMANPQQQYLKTQIETASQPQLLLLIFDAAVRKLHLAKKAIQSRSIEKAHIELTKVQKMFTELMVALDFDIGGDIAHQLMRIYDFIYHRLVQANIRQDISIIDEVLPIVESLREGWVQAVEIYEKDHAGNAEKALNPMDKVKVTPPQSGTQPQPAAPQPVRKTGTYTAARMPGTNNPPQPQQSRLNLRG
ncbi:MAG: flagellar export chaperone FliS [bacterium]